MEAALDVEIDQEGLSRSCALLRTLDMGEVGLLMVETRRNDQLPSSPQRGLTGEFTVTSPVGSVRCVREAASFASA